MSGVRWTPEELEAFRNRRKSAPVAPRTIPLTPTKRSKYGAIKTQVDGITFDSKAEAEYYEHLKLLQRAGEILWFIRQPPFDLPGGVKYRADFLVVYPGRVAVVDVKGMETPMFKVKRKLLESVYSFELEVVKT